MASVAKTSHPELMAYINSWDFYTVEQLCGSGD